MLDNVSMLLDEAKTSAPDPTLNERIAKRVRSIRAARGLSLEALAAASGVSRSMISLVERADTSATAVLLDRLAAGLGVPLASLFELLPDRAAPSPVARRGAQPNWIDPASGYVRRNVSPPGWPSALRIVEVEFPARARVAYEAVPRLVPLHQQVWVLEGSIELTYGDASRVRLGAGDCHAMVLDRPIVFRNPTKLPSRYAVVLAQGEVLG